ncbi:MAG: class I SAM-dependent methyltransferase, partial [Patescibacteria group bacterium]
MSNVTPQELATFYDRMYATQGLKAMRTAEHYEEVFQRLQPVRREAKSLDIGCGTGFFLKAALNAGLDAYGIEISQEALDLSRHIAPQAHLVLGSGEQLPFPD